MTNLATIWLVADNGAKGDLVLAKASLSDPCEATTAIQDWGKSVGADFVTFYVDDGLRWRPPQYVLDVNTLSLKRSKASDWYWCDGVPYCPLCVEESSPPAVDWDDCSRGPAENVKCGCCGGKSNADVPAV